MRSVGFVALTAWVVPSAVAGLLAGCSSTGSSNPNDLGTDGASPSDGATSDTGTGALSDGAGRDGAASGREDGGQLEAGDGPSGRWNCVDAPPDLCFCNFEPTEGGVTACSQGFACCFATATSCECADQESCDFAAAIGAHAVTKCPPE